MTDPIDIPGLRALLADGTPGPWGSGESMCGPVWLYGASQERVGTLEISRREHDNAALIVAAINQLPSLLSELEAARQTIRVLEEALTKIRDIEPTPYEGFPEDLDAQIAACPECQRYKDHPIQNGICNTHRRPIWDREYYEASARNGLGRRAIYIARQALEDDPRAAQSEAG